VVIPSEVACLAGALREGERDPAVLPERCRHGVPRLSLEMTS